VQDARPGAAALVPRAQARRGAAPPPRV